MIKRWIPSWTAAPMNVWGPDAPLSGFSGETIREIARLSIGGSGIVVKLTNEHGSSPIRIDEVGIARAGEDGRLEPLSTQAVTFAGSRSATLYPGAPLLSDPLEFKTSPLTRLAVSYFCSGFIPIETHHLEAQQTAYISVPGNFVDADEMLVQRKTTSHYLLSAIHTRCPASSRAVVCFGDSLTDGYGSSIDADRRWPDMLAERLLAGREFGHLAVLNQGIGGNRLLHSRRGALALERFGRDVLALNGVSHLILLEGINDIVWPGTVLAGPHETVSATDIIEGLRQIVLRAKLAGIKVMLGTVMPFEGAMPEFPAGRYFTPEKEQIRQSVNQFIRAGGAADFVVDFDAAVRDPAHPSRLLPKYDSGDHIHPNDAGYRAMTNAIDLRFFRAD